jgi:hypothetical protein
VKHEGQTSEEQRLLQSEHARLKREVARLEEENAFLKKGGSVLREATGVKNAMMSEQTGEFSVQMMCRLLQVSASATSCACSTQVQGNYELQPWTADCAESAAARLHRPGW